MADEKKCDWCGRLFTGDWVIGSSFFFTQGFCSKKCREESRNDGHHAWLGREWIRKAVRKNSRDSLRKKARGKTGPTFFLSFTGLSYLWTSF